MRQGSRLLRVLFGALLAVPLLVFGPVSPAQADPIPPTNYSPVDISDTINQSNSVYLGTHQDGSVTIVRACGGNSTYTFRTLDNSGTTTQSRPYYPYSNPNYYPSYCGMGWAIGPDGTNYFSGMIGQNQPGVLAFKDDQLAWTYQLNCGPYAYVTSMTVGANGNVYFVSTQNTGSCNGEKLIGLTPTAQPGTNTPGVVLNVGL